MRSFSTLIIVAILVSLSACRNNFSKELSSGEISFSKDTVYLNTVFTNISSSTYNLKVYNKSNNNISIPSVALGHGQDSFYRLNIDGNPGKVFENVEILAKDSIYIFVETTINYTEIIDPIYTDAIVFSGGGFLQDVKLVTLAQDAHFLFPSKDTNNLIETITIGTDSEGEEISINGFYLEDNTTFTNEKPYVIYGYCAVPASKTLTIEAGATIHFHSNSGLIVDKNATLTINGEINNKVLIEGDRLEPQYNDIPGQWGAIWLRAGSKNHIINNTIIKNASAGIIVDSIGSTNSPTLTIKNTQIYNSSNYGILARETNIEGENLVINNSGKSSLACITGGTYNFTHSTFVNYWSNSLRQYPSVFINNYNSYVENGQETIEIRNLYAANFTNCIIDGNNNIELIIDNVEGAIFNYHFKNNMLKFNDYNNSYTDIPEYDFENTNHYTKTILNGEVDFKSPLTNEFIIGASNEGIEKANTEESAKIPTDILGVSRTLPADIGAYQHIIFE